MTRMCKNRWLFSGPPYPFNDLEENNKRIYFANIKKQRIPIPWNAAEIEYSKFYIKLDSEMEVFGKHSSKK